MEWVYILTIVLGAIFLNLLGEGIRRATDIECPKCGCALEEDAEHRTFFGGGYSPDGKESYGQIFIKVRKCSRCEVEHHSILHQPSVSPSILATPPAGDPRFTKHHFKTHFNRKGFMEYVSNSKTYTEEEFQKILERARQEAKSHNEMQGFK